MKGLSEGLTFLENIGERGVKRRDINNGVRSSVSRVFQPLC